MKSDAPRRLTRTEVEALAALFGCRLEYKAEYPNSAWQNTYVVHRGTRKAIGSTRVSNRDFSTKTNHEWSEIFREISGISTANLWEQGKRGMR
jgi:hypothetical protein